MKDIVIILFVAFIFTSCKENVVNGFTADSVKKEIIENLNNSEWEATNLANAYYSEISFDNSIIAIKKAGGGSSTRVNFQVTNVTSPTPVMPDTIQLRLATGKSVDELYVLKDYSKIISLTREKESDPEVIEMSYKRK